MHSGRQLSNLRSLLRPHFTLHPTKNFFNHPISQQIISFIVPNHCYNTHNTISNSDDQSINNESINPFSKNSNGTSIIDVEALKVQDLLKLHINNPINEVEQALSKCKLSLTEDLVLDVLKRHRSDVKPAYMFFNWVSNVKTSDGYSPGTGVYNEMLDILGRNKRFDEVNKVLDEMLERKVVINEKTYDIVVNRYAAGHKIEEATEFFYKRKQLGLEMDLIAFRTLLMCLCRYKHVEAAEFLFHNKRKEFKDEIRTWNVILNGWCVLGNLREAKRVWNDIVTSNCKPDLYTYGIFINSLSKAGKISTAVKLFQAMWEKGCKPDVTICNTIIDGLCFKKRIPEALEIFDEMNERECLPNVATYNTLIKHLCSIRRIEKVLELLNEMEEKGDDCMPNARTYGYLLNAAKTSDEVHMILERMERKGCRMLADTYNLLLRLFMGLDVEDRVITTWNEMEKSGLGPDQRSYTIMVHGLYDKEKLEAALHYFEEMVSKGLVPEPRTKLLVEAMKIKLQEKRKSSSSSPHSHEKRKKKFAK